MNRTDAEHYIAEKYSVSPDYPWLSSPQHGVFRHEDNRKWFAVIMRVSGRKLGIDTDDILDVMNVKCDNAFMGSLIGQHGIYPAYHMNKNNWISVVLDDYTDDDTVRMLIDMSFAATSRKPSKKYKKRETRIQRVIRMEQFFDALTEAVRCGDNMLLKDKTLKHMLSELVDYYEKGQWLSDYKADERGELPSDLKRGVLSEDGVYNLLCDIEQM